ncbi:MAG TPA: hypothetical protein ENJ82_11645, partial [Bacteroidetes bacterium]|nr:hypothetical protein [Bacteroidota bacterium]
MSWKHWPLFLILFTASLFPNSLSKACGWDGEWENEFYRFFDPSYMDMELYEPFQFTWDRLYSYNLFEEKFETAPNIAEWVVYFGKGYSNEDIRQVVYKFSVEAVQGLAEGKMNALSPGQRTNRLAQQLQQGKFPDALAYLLYAKRCEPYCLSGNDWGDAPANAKGSASLVSSGKSAYRATANAFLQQRYAYQIVRLLRYSDQYAEAVTAYEKFALPLDTEKTTIYWWTRAHYAGALRHLKREAQAAYNFAKVFDHCPTRRIQAYYSFRIRSDKVWNETMQLSQNNREKATLHFLRGITPNALAIDEIRQIQSLDPGSDQADVLLLREINKLENLLLGYPFQRETPLHVGTSPQGNEEASFQLKELSQLVNETLRSNKMHDKSLWQLSAVYLTFLSGNQETAYSDLKALRPKLAKEGTFRGNMLDLVFRIAMTQKINSSVENKLLLSLTNLSRNLPQNKAQELRNFMDEALAWLYKAQGQTGKAILARNQQHRLTETANIATINDLLKFEDKAAKTLYEKQLLGRLHGSLDRNGLLELKGTRLLAKNLLPEAIRIFEALPESYYDSEGFRLDVDPFKGHIRDIVNCNEHGCLEYKYNKLTFAKALLILQKKAVQEPEKAAEYYHLLGNAFYNISYFGPAWRAIDYSRSGSSWFYLGRKESWYTFDAETFEENVIMDLPWAFYKKAIEASKNPELAALSCFMAAKCELNEYYQTADANSNDY